MRTFKSTTILRDVRDARKKMRDALDLAHFGVLVNFTKAQSERYLRTLIGSALARLHCTNYEHHLDQYIAKTSSIETPCAWSDSHPSITSWLSHEAGQLFITGRPGTGKSVFAAHMIQKVAKMPQKDGHRGGALLYYFCGADPTVDPYSNLPQKASFKAIAMSFLRQLLSKEHRKSITDVTLLDDFIDYVLSSQSDKYQDADLQKWLIKLLKSFDTVWIIVDAVDQCESTQGRGLTTWILHNFVTQYAHLLLVGSEGSREEKLLANWPKVILGSSSTTQADLEAYSRHVVRSYLPECHQVDETLVQDIVKRSENMLLYVFFLENLIKEEDMSMFLPDTRIELLQKTPPGIFKMYSYYLRIQLQGFTKLPPESGFDRVLEILLKLIVFSPSAVTWEIFLEVLQSSSLPSKLELTRENIHSIARRAAGVLFDIREATVREDSRSSRQHLVPIHRTLTEYFQSSDYTALQLDSNIAGSLGPILIQLDTLYKSVAETGPSSLLKICCIALQDRKFQDSLNRYQHTADLCRQRLDDSSARGVQPDSPNRHDIDRIRLQTQLCQDSAFSSCDSVEEEQRWLDRQRGAVMEDREWSRKCGEELRAYSDCNSNALPEALRDKISQMRYILDQMGPLLNLCQETLSDLQTRTSQNVIFYLHLTGEVATERQYADWAAFESLVQSYLDQLDMLMSAMAWNIFPSLLPVDSGSPAGKLAAMICAVERVSQVARKVVSSSQKSRPYQFLRMMECLWTARSFHLQATPRAKRGPWNPLYSAQIAMGFRTNKVSDKLICLMLESVLLLFADAERLCFTDATLFTGIGNLSFCIRQLRQLVSHYLLSQTFNNVTGTSVEENGFRLNEFSKQGFTKLVLLCDVSSDVVDEGSLSPADIPTADWRSISIGLAFCVLAFLSSHHTCVIFCLLSTPADIPYGAFRLGQTWPLLPFASAAGVVGCSSAKVRLAGLGSTHAYASIGTTIACAVPRQAPAALFMRVLAIISATEYLTVITLGFLFFPLALGAGVWPAIETAALFYGIVHLIVLAVDPSGMKRRHSELARIGRKYKWQREESGTPTSGEMLIAN
ncbi:hypothetical protein C8J57DRAFT_1400302 [Mycena rebaudengoi]|nr:hypothetical protein C8J57DRAFT_1400302 [Mycena rebaudengoi]